MTISLQSFTATWRPITKWQALPIRLIGAQGKNAGKPQRPWLHLRMFAALTMAALMLTGCRHAPPEQALRDAITTMQKAVDARDSGAVLAVVAEDFSGNDGMNHEALRHFVAIMMLQNRRIKVEIGPVSIQIIGDRANANFTAFASGGAGWMPEHGQIYQVSTGWRLDGGDWKLISAKWQAKF